MLYFINMTQVENVNPRWGANFSATSALGEDGLLAAIRKIATGFIQDADAMVADVALYLQSNATTPTADYVDHYGDYRLTITPASEDEYPWIVESLQAGVSV